MSELPIVEQMELLCHPNAEILSDGERIDRFCHNGRKVSALIRELVEALEAARSQVTTLGTPDDAVNNHIIAICDFAIAKAKQPIGGRDGN